MTGSETALYCCFISVLWGVTNPLIKKSTIGITKVKANNSVQKFIKEIKYLVANWIYVLLFVTNQLGSVLYFILLQSVELSLIVPVVNALTFIITGFVGLLIGENTSTFSKYVKNYFLTQGNFFYWDTLLILETYFGIVLILIGITLCVLDKVQGTSTLGI